jgi:recombination protein RecT
MSNQELAQRQTGGAMQSPEQRRESVRPAIVDRVNAKARSLELLLPDRFAVGKFVTATFDAFNQSPRLYECSIPSVLGAVFSAAKLGLAPNTPTQQCWIVALNRQGRYTAEFWLGYRGAATLARRSPRVVRVWANVIRGRDEFEIVEGSDPRLYHRPFVAHTVEGDLAPMIMGGDSDTPHDPRGPLVGAYACAKYSNGDVAHHYMPALEIIKIRNQVLGRQRNKSDSPWVQWEDRMWLKTPVKPLCKFLDLPDESAEGLRLDDLAEAGEDQKLAQRWEEIEDSASRVHQVPTAISATAEEPHAGPRGKNESAGHISEPEAAATTRDIKPDLDLPGEVQESLSTIDEIIDG